MAVSTPCSTSDGIPVARLNCDVFTSTRWTLSGGSTASKCQLPLLAQAPGPPKNGSNHLGWRGDIEFYDEVECGIYEHFPSRTGCLIYPPPQASAPFRRLLRVQDTLAGAEHCPLVSMPGLNRLNRSSSAHLRKPLSNQDPTFEGLREIVAYRTSVSGDGGGPG